MSLFKDMAQRRNSSNTHGVKISAKGKKYFMEALPTTVLSYHNKETMFDYHYPSKVCKRRAEKTKNKLCQITTPNEVVQIVGHKHYASTDTTSDRPCCCPPKEPQYTNYSYNDRYVANVTSKQITPLLIKQGTE